ncbi:MAG: toll/interleukin-1 receptor domain-containing protein, partial [Cyanobacteria bacterium J06649_11]
MNFDVFISHASEDKDDFVRELAEKLHLRRIEVWYDEHSLKIGDSLRQSIDLGLSKSRFGIVVLSKDFFNKDWTNWELDGLLQRQLNSKNNLILPIWHNIEKEDILAYSPSLADKVAIKSNIGIEKVIDRIEKIINPKGSTLIVAREYLISKGYNPPIISDDWWLDVLEYPGDTVLQNDYLKFSIPWFGLEPSDRGKYIGQNALQMLWRENAIAEDISQLSSPKEIIDFINSQAGLQEICLEQPLKTALFFPQLTIKGMGGFMETKFDELYAQKSSNQEYTCIEEVALRDKNIGNYGATTIASFYFSGDGGGIGPSTRLYDLIDCLIWLLSSKSNWLPNSVRNILFNGLC